MAIRFLLVSGRQDCFARTDGDGLDLDTFLDVGGIGVVGVLVPEDCLSTQGVDECSATC